MLACAGHLRSAIDIEMRCKEVELSIIRSMFIFYPMGKEPNFIETTPKHLLDRVRESRKQNASISIELSLENSLLNIVYLDYSH